MAKTIYLVTDGEYSDYHVIAAFSTEAKAQQYIATIKTGGIEEYTLDEGLSLPKRVTSGQKLWQVRMQRDGSCTVEERTDYSYGTTEEYGLYPAGLWVRRWAKRAEDVVKIANEIRAQMIAEGKWA